MGGTKAVTQNTNEIYEKNLRIFFLPIPNLNILTPPPCLPLANKLLKIRAY